MIPHEPSPATPVEPDLARLLQRALLDHYRRTRRAFPWRGETDPYRIWVSEVMLQQTRTETVLGYYGPWLERFPDVDALARASLDDVLLQWQGLGYYRRARNLHRAALVVRERHDGQLPGTREALRALPGVGDYTAGAVASIAFGEAVPAVDGNVRRVLSRLFDEARPTPARLRALAAALVPADDPGDWNQALMDLGATVCTPDAPDCGRCPLTAWCRSRARGTQSERPGRTATKAVPHVGLAAAVVVDARGRSLVTRRPEEGLLGGMWSFPVAEVEGGADGRAVAVAARAAAVEAGANLAGETILALDPIRHRFTHLRATYLPVLFRGGGGDGEGRRWIPLAAERRDVALPVAQQRIAAAAAAAIEGGERCASGT